MKVMLHRITALVLALGTSLSAWAYPYSYVHTVAYGNASIVPPSPIRDHETLISTSGAPLTSESSNIASSPYWTLSAESRAHVQPGVIQLYGSSQASASYDPSVFSYVSATAQTNSTGRWQDSFTIDGGVLNGSVGHLVVAFQVDGTFYSGYDASVNLGAMLDEQYRAWLRLLNSARGQDVLVEGGQRHYVYGGSEQWLAPTGVPLRNPGLWTIAIDFIFGTAIDVDMWGDISNSVTAFACVRPSGCQSTSNIFSTVDFGHTMFWGGITSLTDANGNPVDNYTLTSLSGFDYRFAAVPAAAVPSPSTVLLFMTGLPLLLASRTRRSPSHATS